MSLVALVGLAIALRSPAVAQQPKLQDVTLAVQGMT